MRRDRLLYLPDVILHEGSKHTGHRLPHAGLFIQQELQRIQCTTSHTDTLAYVCVCVASVDGTQTTSWYRLT